ncbi:PepSY-associated TM helix domain-containing protein [Mangrovibacterium lignilyticum]|uniref:PepSY-associated TM helix domain-containing protein n=1 Tax=Mangrovibacterium lignilyticum TaxID=2668052 RepID=UPI0013D03A40|nr:PepSY-associated TM helix domain-containing protein [Mangrovibacterium lignilyticum]
MKNKALKLFRKLHKWPGIIIALLAILFATSGVVMNHRELFSSVDINRQLLPPGYQYDNWNLAAVRGNLITKDSTEYIFGNIGIWEKRSNQFADFNQGFPKGIDHRKISGMAQTASGQLYAATQFGLYGRQRKDSAWHKIKLPIREERLTDIFLKQDSLLVLSRSFLLKSANGLDFECIQLVAPQGYIRETGLFQTLWQLHSGELFGLPGKLFVDLLGLVTILLSLTGLLHFFLPKIAKRRKTLQKDNKKLTANRRLNLRWHNVVGYLFIVFLLINTSAGIFLRPPLLIPIAYTKVGLIPGTTLDNPNPWFDKLRRGVWDETLEKYVLSTADGFYFFDENLQQKPQRARIQPPVSVMGCNVLQETGPAQYLVGSFSGLFVWDIRQQLVIDAFTGTAPHAATGRPISNHLITGYTESAEGENYLFDYSNGLQHTGSQKRWDMSKELLDKTPISLWSTALEVHTGRIFEHLVGPFYILYVPLSGLCLLMVLISGFLIWWKAYRRK